MNNLTVESIIKRDVNIPSVDMFKQRLEQPSSGDTLI